MKLLSSKLNTNARHAVRFTVVGTVGTIVQYGIYYFFLWLFETYFPSLPAYVTIAFNLGFILEMIANYIMQVVYVFETKVGMKTISGFAVGRAVNWGLQNGLLWLLMLPAIGLNADMAGIGSILIAGVVNFFVVRLFFKKKQTEEEPIAE
ncbi:MAG: GtrA family protein [Paludibacteraceae bacterium]|nr:GtrA family protein [Paludibacteraceae bacterium]